MKEEDPVLMEVNPLWRAMSCYRKREFDKCIELCTDLLNENSTDQVRT